MINVNWKLAGMVGAGVVATAAVGYGLYTLFKSDTPTATDPLVEGAIEFKEIVTHDNTIVGYGSRVVNGVPVDFTFSYLNLGSYSIVKAVYIALGTNPVFSIDEANYFVNRIGVPGQFTPRVTDHGYILDPKV